MGDLSTTDVDHHSPLTTHHSPPADLSASYRYCRRLARRAGRNFYFSFLTLRRPLFRDMCALYAFMRISDDLGDDPTRSVEHRAAALASWKRELQQALQGAAPTHPAVPALIDVVRRHGIPVEYLTAVIEGIEMDLQPRGFETIEDLARYCYHVAGAVGLCCIHMWGFKDERAQERAIDCGLAFQLTNILRDLREDAKVGRVYLPREDLARFEYSAEDIQRGVRDRRFCDLMRFEVARTRGYYDRAEELLDLIGRPGRPILTAMLRIYGGLLQQIERQGFDVYTRRIELSAPRKLAIALDSWLRPRGE